MGPGIDAPRGLGAALRGVIAARTRGYRPGDVPLEAEDVPHFTLEGSDQS